MRKFFNIKRKLLNYFNKKKIYKSLTFNETPIAKSEGSYVTIKFHIYIPRYMERIHRVVSLNSFILNVKEIISPLNNKKLSIINCGALLVYIDDYLIEQTYFCKFNSYVYTENSSKILMSTTKKVTDFSLITGRYITANLTVNFKG